MLKFLLVLLLAACCVRVAQAVCGNNIVEAGENCDNTTAGGCCTTNCLSALNNTITNPSPTSGVYTLPYALTTTLASIGLTTAGANYYVSWSILSSAPGSATYDPGVTFSISANTNLNWNRVFVGTFNVTFQTVYCTSPFRALYFQRQLTMAQFASCTCVTDLVHPWCDSGPTLADETKCDCFTRQCYRRDASNPATCGTTKCRTGYNSCNLACADLLVSKPSSFTIIGNDCTTTSNPCTTASSLACTCNPICGDSIVDLGEGCDAGSPAPYGSCCTHNCSSTAVNPTPTTGTYTMATCSNSTTMAALDMLTGGANYVVVYEVVSVTNVSGLSATITGGGVTLQFNKTFAGVAVVTFRALFCNATSQYFTFTRTITGIGCCKNGIVEYGEYCDVGATSGTVGSCCTTDCQPPRFNSGVTYYPFCRGIGRTYTMTDIGLDDTNVPVNALTIIRNQTWYEGVGETNREFYTDFSVPSMITNGTSTYLQFAGAIIGGINITWSYNYCNSPSTTLTFWKTFWIDKCYCDYCGVVNLPGPVVQGVSGPYCFQLSDQFANIGPYGSNFLCDCSKVTCYQITSSDSSICASGNCGTVGYNNCSYACRDVISPKPVSLSLQRRQTSFTTGTTCSNGLCGTTGAGNPPSQWINCTCAPVCGDGILDTGEFCDNGPNNGLSSASCCTTDCQPPYTSSPSTFSYTLPSCVDRIALSTINVLQTGGNFLQLISVANYTGVTGLSPTISSGNLLFGGVYTGTVVFTLQIRWCNVPFQYIYITRTITNNCCDNSVIDPGEQCDLGGSGNGGASTCCSNNCQFRPTTRVCRSSSGACDPEETCTGVSDTCPANVLYNSTVQCRPVAGTCDVAEFCTGSAAACPTDTFLNSSTLCRNATSFCDLSEFCTGSAATCPTDVFKASTVTCRNATGVCDAPENCTGTSATCPTDVLYNSSTVCRPANGGCDAIEFCTGLSNACPADAFYNSTVVCRPAGGPCDAPELCPGNSNLCPADSFFNSSVICRAPAGSCDATEFCTGSGASCPTDLFFNSSVICRAANDTCDVAEFCTGTGATCPANAFLNSSVVCRPADGVCDQQETCTGTTSACPTDIFLNTSTVCRAANGGCDAIEYCPGNSNLCPADAFYNSSVVCRPAGDVCDAPELCPGNSNLCPADSFFNSSVECRAAAGTCDIPEFCTGSSISCPTDVFYNSSTTCRLANDTCDTVELCTGTGPICPSNSFLNSSVVCRPANGTCDQEERCTGTTSACPADTFLNSSTVCRSINGGCDAIEYCPGDSNLCPPDAFYNSSVVCRPSSDVCDAPELCPGNSNLCPADSFYNTSVECRASAGDCDAPEYCPGNASSCPVNVFYNSTVECRPSAGGCDISEFCTGSTATCPANVIQPNGYVCRPVADVCDQAETCDGVLSTCPADSFLTNTQVCRNSTDICDLTEYCTGTSAACPANFFVSAGTVCRPAAGSCDAVEVCDGVTAPCPADSFYNTSVECRASSDVCDSPEFCPGNNANCPSDTYYNSSVVCRPPGGACDIVESCTGSSPACPVDAYQAAGILCDASLGICENNATCTGSSAVCPAKTFVSSSTTCRPSTGVCDPLETCTGSSPFCPVDTFLNSSTQCRSSAGVCDPPEFCTGTSGPCPSNTLYNSSVVCRPPAGSCDSPESCTGSSPTCPADTLYPNTYVCAAKNSTCSVNVTCTGISSTCPSNLIPAGTACSVDGNLCFLDTCAANGTCLRGPAVNYNDGLYCNGVETCNTTTGLIIPGTPVNCSDGNSCTSDTCSNSLATCVNTPLPGTTGPCGGSYGACTPGNYTCDGSGPTPVIACVGEVFPVAEVCFDMIDNDCDGMVDEFCNGQFCNTVEDCRNITLSPCEVVSCDASQCNISNLPENTTCNDHLQCTKNGKCNSFGLCVAVPVVCNDFNDCTFDYCTEPFGACVFDGRIFDGASCPDGTCNSQGQCIPDVAPCPIVDATLCTRYERNITTEICELVPRPGSCDDDNLCTIHDTCINGECVGQLKTCDDFVECTTDSCVSSSGLCSNVILPNKCFIDGKCWNDGDTNQVCSCLMCNASASTTQWSAITTLQSCDDGDPCTENDICDPESQTCQGTPISCSIYDSDCSVGVCASGVCRRVAINENVSCDDGIVCTENDVCTSGVCVGQTVDCSIYSTECMRSSCDDLLLGCTLSPVENYTRCNLGSDVCDGVYYCFDGSCIADGTLNCTQSSNVCVETICQSGIGCTDVALVDAACDDNNLCTVGDKCTIDGLCSPGDIWIDCDDQNDCTDDICVPDIGCIHIPLSNCDQCNTTSDCSLQTCQSVNCVRGRCRYVAYPAGFSCADTNVCNGNEICSGNGVCLTVGPLICDDGNDCTTDTCDSTYGCKYSINTTNSCGSNGTCSSDGSCVQNLCNCPISTQCTQYDCEIVSGVPTCIATPVNVDGYCSSNNSCLTGGVCDRYGVCREQSLLCPQPGPCIDNYICVNNECVPVYVPQNTSCTLGNLCMNSQCDGQGRCVEVSPAVNCTANNTCHLNSLCIPETGQCEIVYAPHETPCDDNNLCTSNDHCDLGICTGTLTNLCLSNDPCHDQGICDPNTGLCSIVHKSNYTPCNDNNVCTTSSVCISGACVSDDEIVCPESHNQCLITRCDPHQGCLFDFSTSLCDDNDLCTTNETCLSGVCGGGVPVNCSYEHTCGISYCTPEYGCLPPTATDCKLCSVSSECQYIPCKRAICDAGVCTYVADDAALSGCEDNQFCNGAEYCHLGTCIHRPPPDCNDRNDCTIDTCDYDRQQCRHTPTGNITCENDDLCALSARCDGQGHCLTTQSITCTESSPCRDLLQCNPNTGVCEYEVHEDGFACDLGNPCVQTAQCFSGVCQIVKNKTCDAHCSCDIEGVCHPLTGECLELSSCNQLPCSDFNNCTLGDRCVGESCQPGIFTPCEYVQHDAQCQVVSCSETEGCIVSDMNDQTPCNTGLPRGPCSGVDVCVSGQCVRQFAQGLLCREADTSGCDIPDYCVDNNDYCPENRVVDDDTSCPGDLFCYTSVCRNGRCIPVTARNCSYLDDECTIGVCHEQSRTCLNANRPENTPCISGEEGQCVPFSMCKSGTCTPYFADDLLPCNDGFSCTVGDHCSGYSAQCVSGPLKDCTGLDSTCSLGFCNPVSGQCQALSINEDVPCNSDSNPCTSNDTCRAGVCQPGVMMDCSYLNSSCQYGQCVPLGQNIAECMPVITNRACDPDFCDGGCTVPFEWWALHNSQCRDPSKQFTWPSNLENAMLCGDTYYKWSQRRGTTVWRILMQQWLAAVLNEANGACIPQTVQDIITDAQLLLLQCNTTLPSTSQAAKLYKSYSIIFKAFNTGTLGPGECAQAPCATPVTFNYFNCLFQTRDIVEETDVELFSAENCINGQWDYVSDTCQCFMGWASDDCSQCAPSVNENEVFLCVPSTSMSGEYVLRSIPIDMVDQYINDDRGQLLDIVRMTGKRSRYPNDGKVDCACHYIGENDVESRDLSIYIAQDDTVVYIGTIEQDLQLCEEYYDITIINANPLCENITQVVVPGNDTSTCASPTDWNYICDCCFEDDEECACPQNDILCLRNHVIQENNRKKLFEILLVIFMALSGLMFFVLLYIYFRNPNSEVPKTKRTTEQKKVSSRVLSKTPMTAKLNRRN